MVEGEEIKDAGEEIKDAGKEEVAEVEAEAKMKGNIEKCLRRTTYPPLLPLIEMIVYIMHKTE